MSYHFLRLDVAGLRRMNVKFCLHMISRVIYQSLFSHITPLYHCSTVDPRLRTTQYWLVLCFFYTPRAPNSVHFFVTSIARNSLDNLDMSCEFVIIGFVPGSTVPSGICSFIWGPSTCEPLLPLQQRRMRQRGMMIALWTWSRLAAPCAKLATTWNAGA